jgi:demethylmenaquinone methyltransferase/2-methoxy-6-polyprenyl-1,4-benzoquinol methylase
VIRKQPRLGGAPSRSGGTVRPGPSPLAGVDKHPSRIAGMFDAIAPRYDFLNHFLSAGLDRRWRSIAIDALKLPDGAQVLDLCTGTADLAVAAVTRVHGARVLGVDFAGEMLRLGLAKTRRMGLAKPIRLVRGDATRIPVGDGTCDATTIGFGIRNVAEPDKALAEIARVLKPGGRLAILEFGQPRIPGIRTLYLWYFKYLLPLLGRLVSRHGSAYSYLPASVGTFPTPAEFVRHLTAAGLSQVQAVPLTFGIVYLYVAEKRDTKIENPNENREPQRKPRTPTDNREPQRKPRTPTDNREPQRITENRQPKTAV